MPRIATKNHTCRTAAGLLGAVCLAVLLLSGLGAACPARAAQAADTSLAGAFARLLEDPSLSTRLQACFLAAGLPEAPELVDSLRRRSRDATDAMERIAVLYALATTTRDAGDCEAFLAAFPAEPQLFFDLMEAEWALARGTLNTGFADFLLLLAYEPATRQKALPHVARIACNMPGELESMGRYWKDPLVGPYARKHYKSLRLDDSGLKSLRDLPEPSTCADTLTAFLRHGSEAEKTAAWLMTGSRMGMSDAALHKAWKAFGEREEGKQDIHACFLLSDWPDDEAFVARLAAEPELLQTILRAEKGLYHPPLQGFLESLWDALEVDEAWRSEGIYRDKEGPEDEAKRRARRIAVLKALARVEQDSLEVYDGCQLERYMRQFGIAEDAGRGEGKAGPRP